MSIQLKNYATSIKQVAQTIPEEDGAVSNGKLSELEEQVQNKETLLMLKKTCVVKQQQQHQHLEEDPGDQLHDQILILGPAAHSK